MKNKNYFIQLLKFIFSIIIVFYHARFFCKSEENAIFRFGYIGVNFYFIVSGYLLINSIVNNKKYKKKIMKHH